MHVFWDSEISRDFSKISTSVLTLFVGCLASTGNIVFGDLCNCRYCDFVFVPVRCMYIGDMYCIL